MVETKPELELPKIFKPLFTPCRYKIYYGGRGGGKSWNFALALLSLGTKKPMRILCTREIQGSIKQSVHKLLHQCIDRMGLNKFYRVTRDGIYGFISWIKTRPNTNKIS